MQAVLAGHVHAQSASECKLLCQPLFILAMLPPNNRETRTATSLNLCLVLDSSAGGILLVDTNTYKTYHAGSENLRTLHTRHT